MKNENLKMSECRNMARKLCKCKKYLFTKYSDVQIGNMCVCVRVVGGRMWLGYWGLSTSTLGSAVAMQVRISRKAIMKQF